MLILCPNCNGALPDWFLRTRVTTNLCPSCYSGLTVELFPALFEQSRPAEQPSATLAEGEACCYEHATKRAVALCNHCGRFLCGLCEVEVDGCIWCPACLGLDKPVPKLPSLERRRVLHDSIALTLSTWPALFMYPTLISAPTTLFLTFRYWKAPSSIIPRNKWRFIVAAILASLQIALIVLGVVAVIIALQKAQRVKMP